MSMVRAAEARRRLAQAAPPLTDQQVEAAARVLAGIVRERTQNMKEAS